MVGMVQGYIVTGQVVLLPPYEALIGISQVIMAQYAKFTWTATETVSISRTLEYLGTSARARLSEPVVHCSCSLISRLARACTHSFQTLTLLEHDCSLHQLEESH